MSSSAPAEPAAPTGATAAGLAAATTGAASAPTARGSAAGTILCANCGAPLAGKYCSECGQRHHHQPVHHFWHFISEAAEDLTHADSRLWRTVVALLFRPGFLTREFLDGRRASYLPPVRLYLVLSVIFFLIVTLLPQPLGLHQEVVTQRGSQIILTPLGSESATPMTAARANGICADFRYDGPWASRLATRLHADCVKVVMGNGDFRESFLHSAGRAMFILLPLLALVMKALYRRPPHHYIEHLLFFVHDHAFLFLVLTVYAPLAAFAPAALHEIVHACLWAYIAFYFYVSMRRVYGQGWLLTGAKLAGLTCAYLVLGTLTIAVVSVYSLLTV